ncbi:leucine-rich repeat-containing protein 1 [Aricia agestis]|uniref:leucine-rich repeat-containing protein 1 n=1 Tax=Aricia agestis TaxID=91739 RepID=UPI001C20B070|nr:leucine-rich repeat-containing protein 1 [Aricia agestis]
MPFDFLCCVRPDVEDVMELDYSHHSLTDVPSEVFIYERTLETLLCHSNRITELPRQLFMCHGLKHLDLSDNELQAIPAAVSSLVNLQHLNISRNFLATIPENMKALKNLQFLDLSVNPLEKLPDTITNLIALQDLYLNDTYLEYLPGNFGRLANLRLLELRDNYLMILPKSLSRSTELQRLDIGQNEFQQFPEVIGRFLKLKELWIDSNSFTSIPAIIKPLENLRHLEASNNMIEILAPEIGHCTQLEDLTLSINSLTQLPDSIGQLSNLTALKLDNNRLFSLPESIGQLKNLEELMLMCNYIDKIPSSIGLLRKLRYLNIDENMLRAIPPEIGSCTKLSVLSLRSNKLTSIPPEIGHLNSLKVLNLVRNSLSCLPQSLLNCDKLVALWLSENQSKPLVPMHSEVDPNTYEQVLTCFLFPQVPLSPVENQDDLSKPDNAESQSATRHISFVDMKPVPKVPEKPGQLRRAPTPYPKELRAMAKHARNIHKDSSQDITPPKKSAVHIKAAKITPTLQQKYVSDNNLDSTSDIEKTKAEQDAMKVSVYDNLPGDNAYDKPLNLDYEQEQTYKSVDHSLYVENSSTKDYNTGSVEGCTLATQQYDIIHNEKYPHSPRQDVVRSSPSLQSSSYGVSNIHHKKYEIMNDNSYQVCPDTCNQMQRLSISSQDRHCNEEAILAHRMDDNLYSVRCRNEGPYDHHYPKNEVMCHPESESNYHDNAYGSENYICNQQKITHRNVHPRKYDVFNYHSHGTRELPSPRVHTVSQIVSSTTMPNLTGYNNMYPAPGVETHHYPSAMHQIAPPDSKIYSLNQAVSSPTYISSQSPELYSPTGHTNATNPYRMTNTPLVSDDGSYPRVQSVASQNMYDIYDAIPASSNTPSVINHHHSSSGTPENSYRGQPPPYHIAAPYTKHAQYFNGTGG